ncbi:hypothetical protein JQK88_10505 [Mesorhizobium caraganae]|uniref:hypothetical protein n=1 Tax=Mesorhizobium caraganae TaxID=483206 RepID=UPI00193996D2|nr:hypothetical protein [Mesorhizobium caraganae]MBM2711677.1 hypothetical protein [Mesorhizobium caraganae]
MGKRGPAPKGEYENKSNVLSTRIRSDTRANLVSAAKASGRSLSQEIEHRLRRTFIDDARIEDAFGGRRNYLLMRMVALAAETAFRFAGKNENSNWLDEPIAFDAAVKMINEVLSAIRPDGPVDSEDNWDEEGRADLARAYSDITWSDVQKADPTLPLDTPIENAREALFDGMLKADLGPLVNRPRYQIDDDGIPHRTSSGKG